MRIGVFCSGGDAPGMNACLRAVVRAALGGGHEVVGIRHGFQGILNEDFHAGPEGQRMSLRCVSGLIAQGGTILRSSRSEEFRTPAGLAKAAAHLHKHGIEALVPIGGDGTLRGCQALAQVWPGRIIACPGTIDNDLGGSDYTIGFHTAVATAVDLVDKLRDTAESHERMFLIEVMGRHSGYIALFTALATGAEMVCLPETPTTIAELCAHIHALQARGKGSLLGVVAEGDEAGGALELQQKLAAAGCPMSSRVVILGHTQRGGRPVPADRILATRLGEFAVRSLLAGHTGCLAGEVHQELVLTPFAACYTGHKPLPRGMVELLETMSR